MIRYRWIQLLFSILVISSLIASCGSPLETEPDIASEETVALEVFQEIAPVLEPQDDLPPALVEVAPIPASLISLDQSITLYFNQDMDKASVEAAIHFDPRISGRFNWEDSQTVTFFPDQTLSAGSQLRLALDSSAQSINQLNLPEAVVLEFQVADPLRVVQSIPADGGTDVDPESVIFVVFNQPVVPIGEGISAEPGFSLDPNVPGKGEWLNSTTYKFRPDLTLDGGTIYTIQLNENLAAISGATFSTLQPLTIDFTTGFPSVMKVRPRPDELLSLDGPIQFDFNLRMNPESVEDQFTLVDQDGLIVPGTFTWRDDYKKFSFTPTDLLSRDTSYTAWLGSDAISAGGVQLYEAVSAAWRTYPIFQVDESHETQFTSYYGGYGQYTISFTAPLSQSIASDPATLEGLLRIDPDIPGREIYASEGDDRLWINGYFIPDTTYTLTLDADISDTWGESLGELYSTSFVTPAVPPSLSLFGGFAAYNLVFVPAAASELVLQVTNISVVSMEIAPINVSDLITLLHPENYDYRQVFLPEVREVITHNLNLTNNRREVIRLPLSYQGEPLTPGVYYLGISTPELQENEQQVLQKYTLVVSENNLVMKVAPDQALVWATRLDDQSPLTDAPVAVYDTEGGILTRGMLDSDGLFIDDFERVEDAFLSYFALVGEPDSEDFSFTFSSWQDPYYLFEQGLYIDTLPAILDAYVYTDRPIYRPGDTVNFKTVVFSRENGLPVRPELDSVRVSIQSDPGMTGRPATIYSRTLSLSQFGTAAGSVILPANALPGTYRVDVSIGDDLINYLFFDVAFYRKPEIDLVVGFSEEAVLFGEEIFADVQADYYFGMPAEGQSFSWTLFQEDGYFYLPGYSVGPLQDFWVRSFDRSVFPLGEVILQGEGKTGEDGFNSLRFTPDDLKMDGEQYHQTHQYHLEVTVLDHSGFPVSFRDTVKVHPGDFYIGVKPDAYFGNAGSSFNFSVLTVDWDKVPVSNIAIDATFESIRWLVQESGNPEMPYQYLEQTRLIGGASPVTDWEGRANISFIPPDPGTYRLTLEAGEVVTQVLIWVSGEGAAVWPTKLYNQIDLISDANEYQPGQVAEIFIPNPFPGDAQALVTIEHERVITTQILEVSEAGRMVSLPITDEYIPNIFVSVIMVGIDPAGRPDYRQGILVLAVSPISKTLDVDLSITPALTEPGELVRLNLKISDQQGNPIQGEFSVVVVDKALLALAPSNSLPILDAIYSDMPLSVQTNLSLYSYANQLDLIPLDTGGLGGGTERSLDASVREDFPDTAFWQAEVITAVDGTAQLSIPLPDSLTTWVVEVRGLDEAYLVGQAEAEIQTQKPLMIQPVTPRFLVDGDWLELAAVVHNNTDEELVVDVSLLATGFALTDLDSSQRVTIEPGQSERVNWWGTVESVESVDLVFQANAGRLVDASAPIWGDLQVKRYMMPQHFSSAGQLVEQGSRLELVSLPISTDPSSGELSIVLNPSLLATLVEGLGAMEIYPYQDTISTLARLLANLNVARVMKSLNADAIPLSGSLPASTQQDISQLLSVQNYDGGWSWWGSSSIGSMTSDPFVTAYVLLGLEEARAAGLQIDESFINRARVYLITGMPQPEDVNSGWELDRLLFITYALGRQSEGRELDFDLGTTLDMLYDQRAELSPWGLGLLALTIRDQAGMTARVNTLVAELEGRALRSATSLHWESMWTSWMLPGTPVFNTSVVLYALAQLDPASTSLSLALRYLMAHHALIPPRSSNFEASWRLMAIAKTMQGTGDYLADYDFEVMLNGMPIIDGTATGPEMLDSISASVSIDQLYPDSPNAVMIERGEGTGALYYRVELKTYQPASTAQAIQGGISLERDYYLAGLDCPANEDCESINSIMLDPDDPSQLVRVVLTVTLRQDIYNLMLKDFIPAGTEILNRGLLTAQSVPNDNIQYYDPRNPFANGWGWWYFNPPQIFDDHLLWTAEYAPAGTYILIYELLPYQRGVYQVLPAYAWQYYSPEIQGSSTGDVFTIE